MTLLNLYLPRPSLHDNPTWISSALRCWELITSSVSAAGASTDTSYCYISILALTKLIGEVIPLTMPNRLS